MHAICSTDDHCDLNPLPGAPSYSLSRLEKEAKELVDLGPWEYFLVKVLAPIMDALHIIGGCGFFGNPIMRIFSLNLRIFKDD